MQPLNTTTRLRRFDALIGTGGIGTGSFFALNGNHTLGREESRAGRFLESRDYAKLHIVCHYVQMLLGPEFATFPVGRVGADKFGDMLREEMAGAGLDLRHVHALHDAPTMNCVCLLYPDGSGGNLTAADSACAQVDRAAVYGAEPEFRVFAGRGIALAVPEVPLDARREILEMGAHHDLFRAASFSSEELRGGLAADLWRLVDLLVINEDEAAALAAARNPNAAPTVKEIADIISGNDAEATGMQIIMTAGKRGSWAWDGAQVSHQPSFEAGTVSAAGAGDAFFAGVLAGLAAGFDLFEAQQLGALTGAFSVTSPHTIHFGLTRASLALFAGRTNARVSPELIRFLSHNGLDSAKES